MTEATYIHCLTKHVLSGTRQEEVLFFSDIENLIITNCNKLNLKGIGEEQ